MRQNMTITIAAGTPINVVTGTSVAPSYDTPAVYATRVLAQMRHGGSGLGYVMDGISLGRIPATTNAGDVTAELTPATATAPGGDYSDWEFNPGGGIDLRRIWIDGGNSGDTVGFSWDLKV